MDAVQQIGGNRLAAPPVGATDKADLSLLKAAERYRELLEAGVKIGVVPQVEVWGFSKSLSRLGEAALVALRAEHRDAAFGKLMAGCKIALHQRHPADRKERSGAPGRARLRRREHAVDDAADADRLLAAAPARGQ